MLPLSQAINSNCDGVSKDSRTAQRPARNRSTVNPHRLPFLNVIASPSVLPVSNSEASWLRSGS